MKTIVKSTEEIKSIFPELPVRDKFRSSIETLFQNGYTFDIHTSDVPSSVFRSKDGKFYFAKLRYAEKSLLLKRVKTVNTSVTKEEYAKNPEMFMSVDFDEQIGTNNETPIYSCKKIVFGTLEWSVLAKYIGHLIKDELVHDECCTKCSGTGRLPQFAHVENGLCFECMGIGKWLKKVEK